MKQYILVQNDKFIRTVNLLEEYPQISFPPIITEDVLPENVKICHLAPMPINPYAKFTLEDPILENGVWKSYWKQDPLSQEHILTLKESKFSEVRQLRDQKMKEIDWRYLRYDREIRLGLPPSDDIQKLDEYMQALADITKQEDPFNIIWPEQP